MREGLVFNWKGIWGSTYIDSRGNESPHFILGHKMSKSYFEPHRVELYRAGEGLAMVEYITLKTIITPIGFEWIGWSEVSHHQLTSAYVGSSLPLVSPDPPTSILRKPSSGLVLGSSFSDNRQVFRVSYACLFKFSESNLE